ncbi:MAG: TetR/AcrR family transcriptional regulator [Polyangiaceae bacterium]|nr:TetR/AcrR family transcriptional regulator [Polyangiaceae bacterium]
MKVEPTLAPRRAYRMGARADAAAATGARIVAAALRQFGERPYDDVSLADVAVEAGVAVQTVLRRHRSKEALVAAVSAAAFETVRASRAEAPAGDVPGAVSNLFEHYEEWGDRVLRFLAQEERVPALRQVTDAGRALHRAWVGRVFAPWLGRARGASRARLFARLAAVTDVYVWKILRRDLALDAGTAERALRELVTAVVG